MVAVITPAIVMIRFERLLENITFDKQESAVKLCRKYLDDFDNKSVTVLTREDANRFSDELFEIELLITLGVFQLAKEQLKALNNKIIHILTQYNMFRNRLMNNESKADAIGTLSTLPNDVLHSIVEMLQVDYVW